MSASWAASVVSAAFVAAGAVVAVGHAHAQPVPQDPTLPVLPGPMPPAPVPVGAPPVPPVPGDQVLQPGQLGTIGDIWRDFQSPNVMDTLFPAPAAPPTPVRQMPMGPPPPLDPAFLPPP